MIRVLLVDDQGMIRSGLRSVLDHEPGIDVVGEAKDGDAAVLSARALRPDVVVMDLRMPGTDGVEATRRIRATEELGQTRILVLTTFDGDREVIAAVRAGADGFLGKSADAPELLGAVRTVAAGDVSLPQHALRALVGAVAETPTGQVAVDDALADRVGLLTEREREVVAAAAHGDDNVAIGRRLAISPYTVKTHLNRAMVKLDARERGQLVALAHRAGLAG